MSTFYPLCCGSIFSSKATAQQISHFVFFQEERGFSVVVRSIKVYHLVLSHSFHLLAFHSRLGHQHGI